VDARHPQPGAGACRAIGRARQGLVRRERVGSPTAELQQLSAAKGRRGSLAGSRRDRPPEERPRRVGVKRVVGEDEAHQPIARLSRRERLGRLEASLEHEHRRIGRPLLRLVQPLSQQEAVLPQERGAEEGERRRRRHHHGQQQQDQRTRSAAQPACGAHPAESGIVLSRIR
jgi:hypothetical protein